MSIKSSFKTIQSEIKNYSIKSLIFEDESLEGGECTGFFKGSELKKIEIKWYGESGYTVLEGYLDNEKIIFVLESEYSYNTLCYITKAYAKENNLDDYFDTKQTIKEETRYYFKAENLILWLDHNGKNLIINDDSNNKIRTLIILPIKEKMKKLYEQIS